MFSVVVHLVELVSNHMLRWIAQKWVETGYDVDCSKVHQCERANTHSIRIETG